MLHTYCTGSGNDSRQTQRRGPRDAHRPPCCTDAGTHSHSHAHSIVCCTCTQRAADGSRVGITKHSLFFLRIPEARRERRRVSVVAKPGCARMLRGSTFTCSSCRARESSRRWPRRARRSPPPQRRSARRCPAVTRCCQAALLCPDNEIPARPHTLGMRAKSLWWTSSQGS